MGYYLIVPPHEVNRTIEIGTKAGYELMEIGWVEESHKPHVYFEPAVLAVVPGGIGPLTVAMVFQNLVTLGLKKKK